MGYKMKGSPAKLGTIKGTSGHKSALKTAIDDAMFKAKAQMNPSPAKDWKDFGLEKEQSYMCVNCGGGFSRDEMCFDTEYDCDFCNDCMNIEKGEGK